jgi:hypothetical protein
MHEWITDENDIVLGIEVVELLPVHLDDEVLVLIVVFGFVANPVVPDVPDHLLRSVSHRHLLGSRPATHCDAGNARP